MTIIDIISLDPSTILGLNEEGYLICWNISPQRLAKENIKDFPFISHNWYEKVLENKAIALMKVQNWVVICGEKEIKVVGVEELGLARIGHDKTDIAWKSIRE